ncbi:MAG: hypothetical protein WA996_12975 [Candidatus Promineifilaceae bacterium]
MTDRPSPFLSAKPSFSRHAFTPFVGATRASPKLSTLSTSPFGQRGSLGRAGTRPAPTAGGFGRVLFPVHGVPFPGFLKHLSGRRARRPYIPLFVFRTMLHHTAVTRYMRPFPISNLHVNDFPPAACHLHPFPFPPAPFPAPRCRTQFGQAGSSRPPTPVGRSLSPCPFPPVPFSACQPFYSPTAHL